MVAVSIETTTLLEEIDAQIAAGADFEVVSNAVDRLEAHGHSLPEEERRIFVQGHATNYRLTLAMLHARPAAECAQALDAHLATLPDEQHFWLRANAILGACGSHPTLASARLPPLLQEFAGRDTSRPPLSNLHAAARRLADELLSEER